MKSAADRGCWHHWAYFMPVPNGLEELARMADEGKVRTEFNSPNKLQLPKNCMNLFADSAACIKNLLVRVRVGGL